MKNINSAIRLFAVRLGLPGGGASSQAPIAGREEQPRTRSSLARWAAVLALAITLAPGAASAQEDGAIRISGLFSMDYLAGTVGPDLAAVYANGHEHTWTLTLHGSTQQHHDYYGNKGTEYFATSFDFEFFGPDAATLNGIVSEHLAGGDPWVSDVGVMYVDVSGPEMYFYIESEWVTTPYPTDANGYPAVGPEPFSVEPDETDLGDMRPGNGGGIMSLAGLVTFQAIPDVPSLTITSSNNVVIVSWPSSATGFALQQNTQLNTTNWVTPMETVTDTGTLKFITVDPVVGSRFYRLFKP